MKFKTLLVLLSLFFGLNSFAMVNVQTFATIRQANPCGAGFTASYNEQTKTYCCKRAVECKEGFEFSTDCTGTATSGSVGYCCKKKTQDCVTPSGCIFSQTATGPACCQAAPAGATGCARGPAPSTAIIGCTPAAQIVNGKCCVRN